MSPRVRRLGLTAHVLVSVGWFGAATAVLVLAVAGLTSADADTASAAHVGTELIWRFAILPFSIAALLTGVVQAVGTPWGLFRHYWVVTKFSIALGAVLLLLLHTHSLLPALSGDGLVRAGQNHAGLPPKVHLVVVAGGTLLLLLTTVVLSVFKPWGKTRSGRCEEAADARFRSSH